MYYFYANYMQTLTQYFSFSENCKHSRRVEISGPFCIDWVEPVGHGQAKQRQESLQNDSHYTGNPAECN